jgi:hypothetical protein
MAKIVEPQPGNSVGDWASGSGGLLLQCRDFQADCMPPALAGL